MGTMMGLTGLYSPMAIWRFRASRKVRLKWRRLSGPTRRMFEYLTFSTGTVRRPRGWMRGSSSSSPRMAASSSRPTSTSRMWCPGSSPGSLPQASPLPAHQLAVGHVLPEVLADDPPDDLLEPPYVAVDLPQHQVDRRLTGS